MIKQAHFIGIGGIGMSGIAQLFLSRGIRVSGSDLKKSRTTDELQKKGMSIFIGHSPGNIQGANLVIYSSAIKQDNPEIQEAKRLNIQLLKRAEALAKLMQDKTVITVTGSHGKTTTTSLVSCLLMEAGFQPTVAIGGILRNIDNNAYLGKGKFFVAEADESDGSFLYYEPQYSIITNIDYEHIDYYGEFKNYINAFKEFINKTAQSGCLFCCGDDENLKDILKDYKHRYVLFGLSENLDIYPKNIAIKELSSQFDCFYKKDKFSPQGRLGRGFIGSFSLALGGRHNISNALSVIALGLELGIDLDFIKKALSNYKGARRRLEIKFSDKNYTVIEDYAHHPTEIKATLEAIRDLKAKRRIVLFQPHRYSRTSLLFNEFAKSFDSADYLIVTDIYPANESPIKGITGEALTLKIKENLAAKDVYFLPQEKIVEHILELIRPNDLVLILGAGDIAKTCDELVERLKD